MACDGLPAGSRMVVVAPETLVREEHTSGTPAVAEVLMNVDNDRRFEGPFCGHPERRVRGRGSGRGQNVRRAPAGSITRRRESLHVTSLPLIEAGGIRLIWRHRFARAEPFRHLTRGASGSRAIVTASRKRPQRRSPPDRTARQLLSHPCVVHGNRMNRCLRPLPVAWRRVCV